MTADDLPVLELAFPGPERDSGVAAILAGEKTALTGLLQIYEHEGEPIPQPGQRFSVLDSAGQSAAVIEVTEVSVVPIGTEGVARFLGATPVIGDDTLVVTERFRLVRPVGDGI